jgi:hypothetical protein
MGLPSVADQGCFMPDPDQTIFSSRIRIQTLFNPGYRILHEKWNANLLFLASYAFRSKVLVLVIVKKIRDPKSGKNHPRIQGVKKHRLPDPYLNADPDPVRTRILVKFEPSIPKANKGKFFFHLIFLTFKILDQVLCLKYDCIEYTGTVLIFFLIFSGFQTSFFFFLWAAFPPSGSRSDPHSQCGSGSRCSPNTDPMRIRV